MSIIRFYYSDESRTSFANSTLNNGIYWVIPEPDIDIIKRYIDTNIIKAYENLDPYKKCINSLKDLS